MRIMTETEAMRYALTVDAIHRLRASGDAAGADAVAYIADDWLREKRITALTCELERLLNQRRMGARL